MDTADLQNIASRTRLARQTGVALIIASALLTLFLFIPLTPERGAGSNISEFLAADAFVNIPIIAKAAIVYDLALGKVLYAKNADAQLPLASLTKLLTVYAALTELSPTTQITVSSAAARAEPPHLFAPGDTLKLEDLARLTLTGSLNDGAAAIAEAAALHGGVSTLALLTAAAASLGLSETYAVNSNGLDVNAVLSGGYSSARDVALLAGALVEKASTIALATTGDSASATTLRGRALSIANTNPNVGNTPHLLLSKTGYTDLAGGNLVLVFDAALGHPVAVVVLGSSEKDRFTDAQTLVAAALAHFAGIASL
ncbi:D-alanyl-D-alanine carboxypeptidase [Candidatus Kaiserbacteria bacterium]|nr:D-alanyl-D-alanine carboxypeptidase [Candidatus Kaiserbacteria bacterium]